MTNVPETLTAVDALRALAAQVGDHSTVTREGLLALADRDAWTLRAPAIVLRRLEGRTVDRTRWLRALSDVAMDYDPIPSGAVTAIVSSLVHIKKNAIGAEIAAEVASHVVEGLRDDGRAPEDLEDVLVRLEHACDVATADEDPYPDDETRLARAPAQVAACSSAAEVVAVIDSLLTVQPGAIPMDDGSRTPPFPSDPADCDETLDWIGPLLAALRPWIGGVPQQALSVGG